MAKFPRRNQSCVHSAIILIIIYLVLDCAMETSKNLLVKSKKVDPKTAFYVKMKGILKLRNMGAPYEFLKAASLNDTVVVSRMSTLKFRAVVPTDVNENDPTSECDEVLLDKVLLLNKPEESGNLTTRTSTDEYVASTTYGYTPKVSTWGVFERPKNISPAFGGGRVINKADMEKKERIDAANTEANLPPALQREQDSKKVIEDAIYRSRGFMQLGNSTGAVLLLESIDNSTSYQSEFGGYAKLELAMALETVGRVEEARALYSKLTRLSWSDKVRRNAGQLLAGLEVYQNVQQDIPPAPMMDALNMKLVSQALEAGLKNEWGEYKRKETTYAPWYGDARERSPVNRKTSMSTTIDTLQDAYNVIDQYVHVAKGVSDHQLRLAVKKLHNSSVCEKALFLISSTQARTNMIAQRAINSTELLMCRTNGTWELVTSFRNTISGGVKRMDPGYHRRSVNLQTGICRDNKRDLWGLLEATMQYTLSSNVPDMRLYLTNSIGTQIVQVVYCDDSIMLTSSGEGESFLPTKFFLWKRWKEPVWRVYT